MFLTVKSFGLLLKTWKMTINIFLRLFVIFFFIPVHSFAQVFQKDYATTYDSPANERDLNLNLLASTFLNNNEFFNPLQEGYTLIGGFFQPSLNYYINQKLILSTGIHIRKFYGDENFADAEPVFSIKYNPNKKISLLLGSYEGGQNHLLPESLFAFENHFTDLVENGFLFNLRCLFIQTDAWLDWEKFIEPGDPFREEFTAGISNQLKILDKNLISLEIPVFFLAHHLGGQINDTDQPVVSLYNLSEGFKIRFQPGSVAWDFSSYIEILVHHSLGDFEEGYGLANEIIAGLEMKNIEINTGYFRGNNFMSFKGLPLYTSFNEISHNSYVLGGINNLLSLKVGYKLKIHELSHLFLRFEGFYNTEINKLDYTFGIHMQINEIIKIVSLLRK